LVFTVVEPVLSAGVLYRRVIDRLITPDVAAQSSRLGVPDLGPTYHPWFPVLAIGLEKVALYSKAIRSDLAGRTRLLSDPWWLVRVGKYLELLTCLGIAEVVRPAGFELLSAVEREIVATAPDLAEVRARLDVPAWQGVWAQHTLSAPHAGLPVGGPGGLSNLLRKQRASLAFLDVHHADLRQAIALAGPDRGGGPRTWRRIFQDAERAVMSTAPRALPELAEGPPWMRELALWRQCGELGGVRMPRWLARRIGDQDGVFASASRSYRASMNAVARWARIRDLMSFAGDECIPPSTSLIEARLAVRLDLRAHAPSAEPSGALLCA